MNDIILDVENFTVELSELVNKYSKTIPASFMNDRVMDLSRILMARADRQLKEAKAQQQRIEAKNDE